MDFKGLYQRNGRTQWKLDMIDNASRLLIASVEFESTNSKVVLDTREVAVKRYGRPQQVLTNNSASFPSVRRGVSAFQMWCIEDRVQYLRARRNPPQILVTGDKIRRTINMEYARMGKELDECIEYYNRESPHSSLGHRTSWELNDTPSKYVATC